MGNTLKNRTDRMPIYHNSCYAMGTRLNVVVTDTVAFADEMFDEIVDTVRRIEAKLSRFDERSDVSMINRYAGQRPVEVDAEIGDILSMCKDYYRRTDGYFDITLPSCCCAGQLHSFLNCVCLDAEKLTIAFRDPAIQIDLGGFGKGYALQAVESILKSRGIPNALVSFGESSILAMGKHPYGDCWKIGIENVTRPGQSAYVFELSDQSLSVSGFQRTPEGFPGFHIISPDTQQPVERTATIAVQRSDPLEAEVLSTAVYAALDTNAEFLANFQDCQTLCVNYTNDELSEIYTYE